jgi:ketosteroid isomerase-like protein
MSRMATPERLLAAMLLFLAATVACAVPVATPGQAARCQVWERELSFARSVAEHDADAFAAHVHPAAVFGVSRPDPQRGRREILDAWAGLISGRQTRLWWYPDRVNAGGDESIVASSGPALYQDVATGQYRLGRFSSVWQRGPDGAWRVVFDDGLSPQAADAGQVEAFHRGRATGCPSG